MDGNYFNIVRMKRRGIATASQRLHLKQTEKETKNDMKNIAINHFGDWIELSDGNDGELRFCFKRFFVVEMDSDGDWQARKRSIQMKCDDCFDCWGEATVKVARLMEPWRIFDGMPL